MKTLIQKTRYFRSTGCNLVIGLIFALTLSALSISSALADRGHNGGGHWGGHHGWHGGHGGYGHGYGGGRGGYGGQSDFLNYIMSLKNYETTVNSNGGGVSISYKRAEK